MVRRIPSVMLSCDKIFAAANHLPVERFDTHTHVMHVTLPFVFYLVKVLAVRNMFLDSQLRSTNIISSQPHCSTNINANMATSLSADDVCTSISLNYYTLLTDHKQKGISNHSLHHETAEALELHSPYTPMNPTWLFEGTFEDWLSKTY
jgi:hypothetical protein